MSKSEAAYRYARKLPCSECPFRTGGFDLEPQRIAEIVKMLVEDDMSGFPCHKDVHHPVRGGSFDDDGNYTHSGKEAECMGAMAMLHSVRRTNVSTRIGLALGRVKVQDLVQSQTLLKPLQELGLDSQGRLIG